MYFTVFQNTATSMLGLVIQFFYHFSLYKVAHNLCSCSVLSVAQSCFCLNSSFMYSLPLFSFLSQHEYLRKSLFCANPIINTSVLAGFEIMQSLGRYLRRHTDTPDFWTPYLRNIVLCFSELKEPHQMFAAFNQFQISLFI